MPWWGWVLGVLGASFGAAVAVGKFIQAGMRDMPS